MTAETDLLPLPEPHWIGMDTCDAPGPRHYTADQMHAYARANVAHAAALQAEVEALRADLEETMDGRNGEMRARLDAEARAERLAELLDQAYGHVPAGALADQIHCALLRFALTTADAALSNGEAEMSDRQSTHGPGCWGWGTKHYECAVSQVERLAEAMADILIRSSIDLVMRSDQFELTARLGDIHQIAGAALAQEADQ